MKVNKYRFGKNIYDRLQEKGKNSVWLSNETDAHETSISNYINGKVLPNAVNFYKIARALDITMDALMEGVVKDDEIS